MEFWDVGAVGPAERTDCWVEALAATHCRFEPTVREPEAFRATVSSRPFGDLSLVECAVTPSGGKRGRREIAIDPGCAGVLVVGSGREWIRQAGCDLLVGPGDCVVWDGDLGAEFEVVEPLRKRTLLLPRNRVINLGGTVPAHVPAGTPNSRLLAGYLEMLAQQLPDLDGPASAAAANAALELLRAVLAPTSSDLRITLLPHVRSFIDARLHDVELDPQQIAAAHAISVRTLHSLFEPTGETLGTYVRRRRLEGAHQDLLDHPGVSVTRIAGRWGFRSAAHFSRSFRDSYGFSPRDVRA